MASCLNTVIYRPCEGSSVKDSTTVGMVTEVLRSETAGSISLCLSADSAESLVLVSFVILSLAVGFVHNSSSTVIGQLLLMSTVYCYGRTIYFLRRRGWAISKKNSCAGKTAEKKTVVRGGRTME